MELGSVKFIMKNTEPTKSKELIQQTKEKEPLYSNSIIKCSHCKVIFPIEYHKCPQCEVDELWHSLEIQIETNFGEK